MHLQPYSSTADFYTRIYPLYSTLLERAEHFLTSSNTATTPHDPDRTILFISAGFDACEHEYPAMQRHDRRVPASFFERYSKDIAQFADKWCAGKVVSVLEGGYSDRALTSGAMGHVLGMASAGADASAELGTEVGQRLFDFGKQVGKEEWYEEEELALVSAAFSLRPRASAGGHLGK